MVDIPRDENAKRKQHMIDIGPITKGVEWVTEYFREDPTRGQNTASSKVRIDDKLTCHVEEGPWKLVADMSPKIGGGGEGPTPGVLGRAALGSCVAIGVVFEAARAGVEIRSVEVEVETDFDDGALFGTSDVPPGYLDVRYRVIVDSDAEEAVLREVADQAFRRSPYLDVFSRAQSVSGTLQVVRAGA